MPKIANYIRDELKAKTVALIWVNNDFGKGGRDNLIKEMAARNIKVVADVSTESGQVDFAADVVKLKAANADAVFVYTNEEECARIMREARKQGLKGPFIGDTTLLSQKTIELAGEAANGVQGHVGLTADAPIPAVAGVRRASSRSASTTSPITTASRATPRVYAVKYVTEKKLGKFDRKAFAQGDARPDDHAAGRARHPDRDHLGRQRRDRPHQLPRRGGQRPAEDHQDPAEARQVSRAACPGKLAPAPTRPCASWTAHVLADILQLLVAGLATGAIYALVAIGFTLLWQTSQTINFAQGEFVMLPAFFVLIGDELFRPVVLAGGRASASSCRSSCSAACSSG